MRTSTNTRFLNLVKRGWFRNVSSCCNSAVGLATSDIFDKEFEINGGDSGAEIQLLGFIAHGRTIQQSNARNLPPPDKAA
ncbi:hypothetical protein NQZ79_g8454 [Umbelopsis isabellina]|nr:hypothetical protein NQZ79_g8454 [Umbelopsis isabellina]